MHGAIDMLLVVMWSQMVN